MKLPSWNEATRFAAFVVTSLDEDVDIVGRNGNLFQPEFGNIQPQLQTTPPIEFYLSDFFKSIQTKLMAIYLEKASGRTAVVAKRMPNLHLVVGDVVIHFIFNSNCRLHKFHTGSLSAPATQRTETPSNPKTPENPILPRSRDWLVSLQDKSISIPQRSKMLQNSIPIN